MATLVGEGVVVEEGVGGVQEVMGVEAKKA